MKKKISIIGHYGKDKPFLDGQTIKTKILTEELVQRFGESAISKVDTYGGKKVLPKLFFKCFASLQKSKNIIILPAHNGLRFFVPILTGFNRFFKRKLFYVVIGGWLPSYLHSRKGLAKKLKKFDGIFVETNTMKKALEEQGFTNIEIMPNFKRLKVLEESELIYPDGEPYKLCTFSRVMKEKGIEDAVNAVKMVNEQLGRIAYTLDIYGQIDGNQTEWFKKLQQDFPEYVRYGGVVAFDKSVDVLKDYFALLFPTYYQGEGFAGTIIDSFAAGIPVIASDWRYNPEIISDYVTGRIFSVHKTDELEQILASWVDNITILVQMKENCLSIAREYLPEKALSCLLLRID